MGKREIGRPDSGLRASAPQEGATNGWQRAADRLLAHLGPGKNHQERAQNPPCLFIYRMPAQDYAQPKRKEE